MSSPQASRARPAAPVPAVPGPLPGERSPCARHLRALADLSHALQAAATLEGAMSLIAEFLPRLFHGRGGAIYLRKGAYGVPRRACGWGDEPSAPGVSATELDDWPHGEGAGLARDDAVWLALRINDRTDGLIGLACPGAEADALMRSAFTASAVDEIALEIGNMRSRDALRELSIRDPLTGLYNRRYLEESLQREIVRGRRIGRSKASLAVLMIDVDEFKRFNDEHGHEAGDMVLAAIGSQLRRLVRASDIASRYGGEEFLVVLPEVTQARALARAEQIRAAVAAQEVSSYGERLPAVTVSIGLAMHPQHGDTVEALVRAADFALYGAKRGGRDRIRCVTAEELHDPDFQLAGGGGARGGEIVVGQNG